MADGRLDSAEIAALLTPQTLKKIAPNIRAAISKTISSDGPGVFANANIDTLVRIAHFFAQILKETGGLKRLDENLTYTTARRIRAVWPSRFRTEAAAQRYVRKPVELANFVYANKNGNGSVASGDGWTYRGSGLIQLTGRGNFRAVGESIGLDDQLVDFPDQVREPDSATKIAVAYWTVRDINRVADGATGADVDKVTRLVNPYESTAGKRERQENFEHALRVLRAAQRVARKRPARKRLARIPSIAANRQILEFGAREAREAELEAELSTEPSAEALRLDRLADKLARKVFPRTLAIPPVYWPNNDANTPDYFHVAKLNTNPEDQGDFELTPADLELLLRANHFEVPKAVKTVAIALRGAMLGGSDEAIKRRSIRCMDIRPDHANFRCLLGFWYRGDDRLTLFSGSTVPCPMYMKNYYFKKNDLPYQYSIDCNMAPTGHYVFRVGTHASGTINPALRMSEPDNLAVDCAASVWRTQNDVTYGLADVLEPPTRVYDNVHCSYFLNYQEPHEAKFSSAGCLTVRGRKDPSDQWKKYQAELDAIGSGKRVDLVLLTGKEAALISQARAAGAADEEIIEPLRRIRLGSSGPTVEKLQRKLGVRATGYFGAETQHALYKRQKQEGLKRDAIYSPATDQSTGWGVLDA
jgi:predicted chitinase